MRPIQQLLSADRLGIVRMRFRGFVTSEANEGRRTFHDVVGQITRRNIDKFGPA